MMTTSCVVLIFLCSWLSRGLAETENPLQHTERSPNNDQILNHLAKVEERLKVQEDAVSSLKLQLQQQAEVYEAERASYIRLVEDLMTRIDKQDEHIAELCGRNVESSKPKTEGRVGLVSESTQKESSEAGAVFSNKLHNNATKRADDLSTLEPVVNQLSQQVTQLTSDVQALKYVNTQQTNAIGSSYLRWGHTGCPGSAERIYTGTVAGTHNGAAGGAGNHLCLTTEPIYDNHPLPSGHGHAEIYGSEYEVCPEVNCQMTPACSACRIPRAAFTMIPGTTACPNGWTSEYSGYIMSGLPGETGGTEFICVDGSQGYEYGSHANDNQNLLHYTVSKCGALSCPPYVDNKILTCVVCSK